MFANTCWRRNICSSEVCVGRGLFKWTVLCSLGFECSFVKIVVKWYFNNRGTEWKRINTTVILFYSGDTRTPLQTTLNSELVATPQLGMNTKLKLVFESSTEKIVASNKRRNWRSEITAIYGSLNSNKIIRFFVRDPELKILHLQKKYLNTHKIILNN